MNRKDLFEIPDITQLIKGSTVNRIRIVDPSNNANYVDLMVDSVGNLVMVNAMGVSKIL